MILDPSVFLLYLGVTQAGRSLVDLGNLGTVSSCTVCSGISSQLCAGRAAIDQSAMNALFRRRWGLFCPPPPFI